MESLIVQEYAGLINQVILFSTPCCLGFEIINKAITIFLSFYLECVLSYNLQGSFEVFKSIIMYSFMILVLGYYPILFATRGIKKTEGYDVYDTKASYNIFSWVQTDKEAAFP